VAALKVTHAGLLAIEKLIDCRLFTAAIGRK
jgi:hypothetical protein